MQITAQGPQSILCFYNAISGGRLATVNLRGAAVEACFTRDGRQVVVAFRVIQKESKMLLHENCDQLI